MTATRDTAKQSGGPVVRRLDRAYLAAVLQAMCSDVVPDDPAERNDAGRPVRRTR